MKRITEPQPAPIARPERVVLYVEDEAANWEVTELRLRGRFTLIWARSAEEACTAIRAHDGKFHAVLMDLQLKGSQLDGLQLTALLKHRPLGFDVPEFARNLPTVDSPIFFVTAFGAVHGEQRLQEVGGDAYVPKPVDFVKLSNLLASTAARRVMEALKPKV